MIKKIHFCMLIIFSVFNFHTKNLFSTSQVFSNCPSVMLGNLLFSYCFGRIIAEKLGFNLVVNPIPGFPNTNGYNLKNFDPKLPRQDIREPNPKDLRLNLKLIFENKRQRNVYVYGFFERYEYYKDYKEVIRSNWLKMSDDIPAHNPNDIVLHIRTSPILMQAGQYTPFEFYEKALTMAKYDKVYICTNEPDHKFINLFKKYNPIIIKHKDPFSWEATLSDFKFIKSFNKIIISQSTYSWWAAFLSNAQEIYAPKTLNYGLIGPNSKSNIELFIPDEERYKFIDCTSSTNWNNFKNEMC